MYTCKDVLKLIPPYIDGEFTDEERAAVENHVSGCESCREAVATERAFKAGLRAKLTPPREPSGLRAMISTSLDSVDRDTRGEVDRGPVALPAVAIVFAAAAGLLFAFSPARKPLAPQLAIPAVDAPMPSVAPRTLAPTTVAALPGSRSVNLERVRITVPTSRGPKAVWVEAFDPRTVQFQRMEHRRIGRHDVWITSAGRVTRVLYRRDDKAYSMTSELSADELVRLVAHQLHGEH